MTSTDATLLERFRAAAAVLAELPSQAESYAVLSEADLLEANQLFAHSQVALRNGGALIAGEIAHRSAPELGFQGLARRAGQRTAEQFIRVSTGATGRDAGTSVRIGALMREAATAGDVNAVTGEVATPTQPWLAPVVDALKSRSISIEAAEAIRAGLGIPTSSITAEQLRDAASQLRDAAVSLDPDALAREARAFRDELDIDGVALREAERRQKRSLRLFVQTDGTTKLIWIMDPETAARVRDLYDRTTSPKLGGIRFVDKDRQSLADSILRDERTIEQLASDGFEQLLALGADADPRFLLGSGAPVVRITAMKTAVDTRKGFACFDGQESLVSVQALERLGCGGIVKPVILDETGTVLDFGREHRFFAPKQKEALALKWGGCASPGCDRPPSWTEAHHIEFWLRDHGKTNIRDGILLCRHHHLLFHNNGWEIQRDEYDKYWLIPPPERDTNQRPIELVTKGKILSDLLRQRAAG
jgi:hypothetical protein